MSEVGNVRMRCQNRENTGHFHALFFRGLRGRATKGVRLEVRVRGGEFKSQPRPFFKIDF